MGGDHESRSLEWEAITNEGTPQCDAIKISGCPNGEQSQIPVAQIRQYHKFKSPQWEAFKISHRPNGVQSQLRVALIARNQKFAEWVKHLEFKFVVEQQNSR